MRILLFLLLITSELFSQQEFFHAQNKGLLLDEYPNAAAAYSLRRVNSRYTGALIRVRRDSTGQAEQDIGSIGEALDTVALKAFVRNNSGFVTTWYDQSGNARNATQTTAANQPRIVNAGVVGRRNGKPTLFFDGSNDNFITANYDISNASIFGVSIATGSSNQFNANILFSKVNSAYSQREGVMILNYVASEFSIQKQGSLGSVTASKSMVRTNLNIFTGMYDNVTITAFVNSVAGTPLTTVSSPVTNPITSIGSFYGNFLFQLGDISEIIVYGFAQTTNRTQIERNINSYYAIY